MKKELSEADVLKVLDIPDFRSMTKDKVMSFTSLMSKMDPEVAKAAIKQFPEFAKMALEAMSEQKSTMIKGLDENTKSSERVFTIYDEIIDTLKTCATDEDISFEDKQYYIEKMIEISKEANQKDESNKKFNWKMVSAGAVMTIAVIGAGAALLGGETDFRLPKS